MTLEFSLPEIVSIILSIWIVGQIAATAKATGSKGVQLLSVYVIIGVLFFFLPAPGVP